MAVWRKAGAHAEGGQRPRPPGASAVLALASALALALSGCVVIPYRPAARTRHDLAAIASPEQVRLSAGPRQFLDAMAKATLKQDKRLQEVDRQLFLDTASPSRELTVARLLDPATRVLAEPLQVDYLVLFGEPRDQTLDDTGGMVFYLGFFGLEKSQSSTMYWAAVVDARRMRLVEQLTSEAVGTDAGVGLFYGLFVVSDTSGSARQDAVRQVVATIAAARPSGPARVVFLAVEHIPTADELADEEFWRRHQAPRWSRDRYPPFHETPPPPPGQALVYFYRPEDTMGFVFSMDIRSGSGGALTQVARLWNGGYFPCYLPAGPVTLQVLPWLRSKPSAPVSLDIQPGTTYYVKGMNIGSFWSGVRPGLAVVDAREGATAVRKLRLMPSPREADVDTRELAERGEVGRQTELAMLYMTGVNYADGEPLQRDDVAAYKWLSIAAAGQAGRSVASATQAELAHRMPAADVAQAEMQAREWIESFRQRPRPRVATGEWK